MAKEAQSATMTETPEQIADRIARDWFPERGRITNRTALSNDILSALRNEREDCARVLESKELSDPSMFGPAYRNGWNDAVKRIAKAIREGR